MKIFAAALAGVLGACVLASAPVKAAPFDPFDINPGEDYYASRPYGAPVYGAPGYYGQGQAAGSTDQAQVAPIPRELVPFTGRYAPGTIVVSTSERRLYYVLGDGMAIRYGVGVGRPGFTWSGTKTVVAKREWPSWTPPKEMLARRPDLPRYMAGGLDNPLGARAMYIGGTLYRIHGSNEPDTIGQAVSSGCIRMTNEDVTDLYSRVKVGAKVVVLN
ncbi:L,D-transpeptidase [Methylobacterium oryzisoli]|uniref:L,D-transpeptidase n=1 Tax=Methylobacterium oryzisoli TaxID=3385502 RepID=UPI00389208CF